jgi:hypothetical protein
MTLELDIEEAREYVNKGPSVSRGAVKRILDYVAQLETMHPEEPDRWVIHRGSGVRDTVTGATLWCHNNKQEQSRAIAEGIVHILNIHDKGGQ